MPEETDIDFQVFSYSISFNPSPITNIQFQKLCLIIGYWNLFDV